MKLKEILKNIDVIETKNTINIEEEILGLAYNSLSIKDKEIFVAIKGYITDGHKYIEAAYKAGAKYAIVEYFVDSEIGQIKIKNTRQGLARLANNFYKEPSKKIEIVGITATNGKTTTAFMLDKLYKDAGYENGIIGTVYTKYTDVKIPSLLTTPESLDLQKTLADMKDKAVEKLVMEVSSSAQELYRVYDIDFDIVAFNNFSREHIDQHGSFEKYYEAKSKLIKEAKEDAIAILNMDFDHIARLKNQTKAKVLTYSLKNKEYDFSISDVDLSSGNGKFTFSINRDIDLTKNILKKQKFEIELAVAGYSSIMNSVVAIIIALAQGIPIEQIKKSILEFRGVERRFEMVYDSDFKIIDDHFANIKNIDVTLDTLSMMEYKNLNILYAIRGNRGINLNKESSEKIAEWIKKLKPKTFFASLSKDVVKDKDKVSQEELDAFKDVMQANGIEVKIFDNLKEAVEKIIDSNESKDVTLLAGCQGMDKGAKIAYDYMEKNKLIRDTGDFKQKIDGRTC